MIVRAVDVEREVVGDRSGRKHFAIRLLVERADETAVGVEFVADEAVFEHWRAQRGDRAGFRLSAFQDGQTVGRDGRGDDAAAVLLLSRQFISRGVENRESVPALRQRDRIVLRDRERVHERERIVISGPEFPDCLLDERRARGLRLGVFTFGRFIDFPDG